MRKILIVAVTLFIVGGGALFAYRIFFLQMIRVPTGSMANTIVPGDQLVVNKVVRKVERGDLITFKWPKDQTTQFVSRVIGLPGETIEVRDQKVLIEGRELNEERVIVKQDDSPDFDKLEELSTSGSGPYRVFVSSLAGRDASRYMPPPDNSFGISAPFRIPENQYFVMGDNRENSYDSRFWGTVPRELITGKPTLIYWSDKQDPSGEYRVRRDRIFARVK
jgi:signal peptidase I